MGLRGPKPKPDGHAKTSKKAPNAPKSDGRRPPRPEKMDEDVARHWDETIEKLQKLNVLDSADGAAVLRYAVGLAEMEALIDVRTMPAMDKKEWHARWNQLCVNLSKLEACFGFTPADRTRVNMNGPKKHGGEDENETTEATLLRLVTKGA